MQEIDLEPIAKELMFEIERLAAQVRPDPKEVSDLENRLIHLLNMDPDYPKAQFLLGIFYMKGDRSGLAINLLKRCDESNTLGPAPLVNLGVAYKVEHKDDKAAEYYRLALRQSEMEPILDDQGINRNTVQALNGLASLHINAGNPTACLHWAEKALEIDRNDRFALWNRGLALLEKGEWEEGFQLYDVAGYVASPNKAMERKIKTYGGLPKWDGTPGKTVICYGEQGIGDEVMFASMLPDLLKDCKVIIDCDPRLEDLFKRSFPEAEAVYPTSEVDAPFPWIENHKVDAHIPMGSLGRFYRKKDSDFPRTPFLVADEEKRERWREVLAQSDGLKIGFSYCGGFKKTRMDKRSIVLEEWKDILQLPNCHFFSLQYHPWAADEAAAVGTKLKVPLHHWGDMVGNYDETAAFISELDLVITVNTSLAHLCGAIGVPTLCLTPKYVAWRYGLKGPNPFYDSLEMIRQSDDGDWGPVLRKAKEFVQALDKRRMKEAA